MLNTEMIFSDSYYLGKALDFANQFDYRTYPNPCVGCVLVKNGEIVSYGASEPQGKRHAEVAAIDNAKLAGVDVSGCCAYVTLEPCCHFGKTPPCTSYLLSHNIKKVVIGLLDPNPLVSSKGADILKSHGVEVIVIEDEKLNEKIFLSMRGFLNFHTNKKPWIRLKTALSIDGVMALSNGVSQWITGIEARLHNQRLRARAGAVLTSIKTVICDNPLMNVREFDRSDKHFNLNQPLRVVLDTHANGSDFMHYEIFKHQDKFPLLWICGENCDRDKFNKLSKITNVIKFPLRLNNHICLNAVINYLYELNINEVHVEAGAILTSAFIEQDLFDETAIYQAPVFLGNGTRLMRNIDLINLENMKKLKIVENKIVGQDLFIDMVK